MCCCLVTVLCPFRSFWAITWTLASLTSHSCQHSLCADEETDMAHGGLPVALAQQELEQDLNLCPPEQIPGSESLCVRLGDRVRIGSYQATAFALCSHQHREGGASPPLFANRMSVPRQAWQHISPQGQLGMGRKGSIFLLFQIWASSVTLELI